MAEKQNHYNAEDIKILEGLDAVRLRPGMYIGSTGVKGLHHILWEIVDNAIDEAASGFATRIEVRLYKDGSASVEDNGRGIPTEIQPQDGRFGRGSRLYPAPCGRQVRRAQLFLLGRFARRGRVGSRTRSPNG